MLPKMQQRHLLQISKRHRPSQGPIQMSARAQAGGARNSIGCARDTYKNTRLKRVFMGRSLRQHYHLSHLRLKLDNVSQTQSRRLRRRHLRSATRSQRKSVARCKPNLCKQLCRMVRQHAHPGLRRYRISLCCQRRYKGIGAANFFDCVQNRIRLLKPARHYMLRLPNRSNMFCLCQARSSYSPLGSLVMYPIHNLAR